MSQDRFLESGEPSPDDIQVPDLNDLDTRGLDLPAPEIDLGGGEVETSDKPLGPRRLALLREQMEQHARELAEKQSDDPEHVDEDLAQKQRRMAELSSRAARSSDEDRQTAERAMAIDQERADDDSPVETTSIPADQVRRRALRAQRAATEDEDAEAAAPSPDAAQEPEPGAHEPEPEVPDAGPEAPDASQDDDAEPALENPATAVEETAADGPEDAEEPAVEVEQHEEPGKPVRALDAEGLELLDDKQYRESSGTRNIILLLVSLVGVALVVALIILL